MLKENSPAFKAEGFGLLPDAAVGCWGCSTHCLFFPLGLVDTNPNSWGVDAVHCCHYRKIAALLICYFTAREAFWT